MAATDHFAVPDDPSVGDGPDNIAENMAVSMDPYLKEAQELERKAGLLRVLPEHDEEGQLVRQTLLTEAAVYRRAAKTQAQQTWHEKDRLG